MKNEAHSELHTIAFYNVENLFDIYNDKHKHDNDFLPKSEKHWTANRYKKKLDKISYVLSQIGKKETGKMPQLIGLAEIENASVLKALLNTKHLKDKPYRYVHFDSEDERGIDVAFLYDTAVFEVKKTKSYNITLKDEDGGPDYTRNILYINGLFKQQSIHLIINHWPSKRDGEAKTEHKRITASHKVIDICNTILKNHPNEPLVIMGDFNDDPSSKSIKQLEKSCNLVNPFKTLMSYSRGTSRHRKQWNLFDQILVSTHFFENDPNRLEFEYANIFDESFLKIPKGKYKGSPYRTYVGTKYKGGFSDHFPVYITLKK